MTPVRELIVWTQGAAHLFSDALHRADLVFGPDPLRALPDAGPSLHVIPTPDGDAVWLAQPGSCCGGGHPTLVELVELPTGRRLRKAELEPNAFPVAATGTGLVVNGTRDFDTGDGWVTEPGSQRVVHLDHQGGVVEIGKGSGVAASSTAVLWLACPGGHDGCEPELHVSRPDGTDDRIVPRPAEGAWIELGGPDIPSSATPLQTVSPDGSALLIAIGHRLDFDRGPAPSTLLVVDLENATSRAIGEFEGPVPLATWSHDGRWAVLLRRHEVQLIHVEHPHRVMTLPDVIPKGHFPLAAG